MSDHDVFDRIRLELERAEAARQQGNEGMARVCARRAAGLAAQTYLREITSSRDTISGLDAIRLISQDNRFPISIRRSANFLTMRVNTEHCLPLEIDLLQEARKFINELSLWMEEQIG